MRYLDRVDPVYLQFHLRVTGITHFRASWLRQENGNLLAPYCPERLRAVVNQRLMECPCPQIGIRMPIGGEMNTDPMTKSDEIRERISDMADRVRETAGRAGERVADTLEHQKQNAADGLDRAASALHHSAKSLPGQKVVNFTHGIANKMGSAAGYLRESNMTTMRRDTLDLCRRYPAQSLVAALTVGFLIGRMRRR